MTVWWCLTTPRAFRLCLLFCHPVLRFSASVGTVLCSLFGFLCLRVGVLLACGVWGTRSLRSLCSLSCPSVVGPPSAVPACPPPALAGQVVWSQSFGPSGCSCWLSSGRVSAAAFCPLGLLSHPLLLFFLAWVSSFGVCSGLGWKVAVLSWILPSFGRGSPSLVLVGFCWAVPTVLSRLLEFLELLFWGCLSSRLQCLLLARAGWQIVLGYPPSVA